MMTAVQRQKGSRGRECRRARSRRCRPHAHDVLRAGPLRTAHRRGASPEQVRGLAVNQRDRLLINWRNWSSSSCVAPVVPASRSAARRPAGQGLLRQERRTGDLGPAPKPSPRVLRLDWESQSGSRGFRFCVYGERGRVEWDITRFHSPVFPAACR
jgi:hypothetical protein